MRGRLIVVEGLDGTGKSTFCAALAAALGAELLSTPGTRLSGARREADEVFADVPEARVLWYAAAVQLGSAVASSLVANGRDVVMDRYWYTTAAYASVTAPSFPTRGLAHGILKPDSVIVLDAPDAVRAARIHTRGSPTAHDQLSIGRASTIRTGYERALAYLPPSTLLRLDGTRPTQQLVQAACAVIDGGGQALTH